MVQAVIVAAGIGSRLYPISEIIPKIMLPVGVTEQPLALKIIEHCKDHGIVDFLFCLNKKMGQQVANFLGDGARFGVNIKYSTTSEPLGTAGELRRAWDRELIKKEGSLIYYGDTLCSTNLTEMINMHDQNGADVSIVINDNIRISVGYVEDYMGLVTLILEKPTLAELSTSEIGDSGGILPIFFVTNDYFYSIFCAEYKDVVGDVLREMLDSEEDHNILAYHDKNPFLDIGDFKNYTLAKKWK